MVIFIRLVRMATQEYFLNLIVRKWETWKDGKEKAAGGRERWVQTFEGSK